MRDELPEPKTTGDYYLRDIAISLRQMAALWAVGSGMAQAPKTPLPDGFPGRETLTAAGIEFVEDVPKEIKALMRIRDMDALTVNLILSWFKYQIV